MDFKQRIQKLLLQQGITANLEIPPDSALGDYALPCFDLAKERKKAPAAIAKDIAANFSADFLEKVEAAGPYVNFFIKSQALAAAVLAASQNDLWSFGKAGKRILVEYPGPNTNKPLHIGHVRNMTLGSTIINILRADGNTVFSVNINNDRGVHICKSMLAYQRWGNGALPDKKSDHFVGDWYVRYANEAKLHPELEDEIQQMLVSWESNDDAVRALWKKMNAWVLDGFSQTYKRFNISFDKEYYESEIYKDGKKIVLDNMDKFTTDETGSVIAPLSQYSLQDKVLLRKDGTSIYITQDIALTLQKMKDFNPDIQVWVVGNEQILHFKQLFAILKMLGTPTDSFHHLSYGLVALPDGRMKSREGKIVDADDMLDEIEALVHTIIEKNHPEWSQEKKAMTASAIAQAAIRFFMIKFDSERDFVFNPESSLSFEGDTGPYLQYTHARICSILAKTSLPAAADAAVLVHREEQVLLRALSSVDASFRKAVQEYKPHIIASQLLEIARSFNTFYHACPVLQAPSPIREARLILIDKTRETLATGLGLLGIDALREL